MVDFGMPPAMREALAKKYAVMQQQANADTMRAQAQANLQNQTAKTVVPLANSSIAVDSANNKLTAMETVERPKNYASDRRYKDLQSDGLEAGLPFIAPQASANVAATRAGALQSLSSANQSDATAATLLRGASPAGSQLGFVSSAKKVFDNISGGSTGGGMRAGSGMDFGGSSGPAIVNSPITQLTTPMAPSISRKPGPSSLLDTPSLIQPFKAGSLTRSSLPGNYSTEDVLKQRWRESQGTGAYKRGTTRVPGKGEGDIKPAMLEPGEAVLNKHAAGMLGRDKIAKLNKAGNEKRAKQDSQRMSKLAQALKAAGML